MGTPTLAKVTVSVTQKHIDNGRPGDCAECAVALALLETFPDATHAEVWVDNSAIPRPGNTGTYALVWLGPDQARTRNFTVDADGALFVADFDEGETVTPLTFTMTEVSA